MGVTGTRESVAQITKDTIKCVKLKTKEVLPVFVGFGISKPEHASAIIDAGADGIIIGSAIVNIIKNHLNDFSKMEQEMEIFISNIKNAIKETS